MPKLSTAAGQDAIAEHVLCSVLPKHITILKTLRHNPLLSCMLAYCKLHKLTDDCCCVEDCRRICLFIVSITKQMFLMPVALMLCRRLQPDMGCW